MNYRHNRDATRSRNRSPSPRPACKSKLDTIEEGSTNLRKSASATSRNLCIASEPTVTSTPMFLQDQGLYVLQTDANRGQQAPNAVPVCVDCASLTVLDRLDVREGKFFRPVKRRPRILWLNPEKCISVKELFACIREACSVSKPLDLALRYRRFTRPVFLFHTEHPEMVDAVHRYAFAAYNCAPHEVRFVETLTPEVVVNAQSLGGLFEFAKFYFEFKRAVVAPQADPDDTANYVNVCLQIEVQ